MRQFRGEVIEVGVLARKVYLSRWHYVARNGAIPLAVLLWVFLGSSLLLAVLVLVVLQAGISWLPEIVDRLEDERRPIAGVSRSYFFLLLEEKVYISRDDLKGIVYRERIWPLERASIVLEHTGGTRVVRTKIVHTQLIRFLDKLSRELRSREVESS